MGEHLAHVGHVEDFPLANVIIEVAPVEHTTHISHIRYIPPTDVASKWIIYVFAFFFHIHAFKHMAHVRHVGDVPLANATIEFASFE